VAQTQNETPSSAISASAGVPSSVENNPTAQEASAVNSAVANPVTAAVLAGVAATNKLANPSIAKLPTGGGDDDDDDDDEEDDD
jgi:hypothetical protein